MTDKKGRTKYGGFEYNDLIMDCAVNQIVFLDHPVVLEIGYLPKFCAQKSRQSCFNYIKNGLIYLYDISKLKWIHDGNALNEFEKIEDNYRKGPEEYADLLELLQGLVVPIKGDK